MSNLRLLVLRLKEGTLLGKWGFFCCGVILTFVSLANGHCQTVQDPSQGQPSLGDIARKARASKNSGPPQKVITNDDVSPNSGSGLVSPGTTGDSKSPMEAGAKSGQATDLDGIEAAIDKFNGMDRSSLVKLVLQGNDTNFPGRPAWEQRLMNAKQDYVAQLRDLVREARQIRDSEKAFAASHAGQGSVSDSDPQVLQIKARIKNLSETATQIEAAFQAVVLEGRNRANEAAAH